MYENITEKLYLTTTQFCLGIGRFASRKKFFFLEKRPDLKLPSQIVLLAYCVGVKKTLFFVSFAIREMTQTLSTYKTFQPSLIFECRACLYLGKV
jgi:hypothetical protein